MTDKELTRLEAMDRELAAADAEFEHHLRRYNDQLERAGNDWGIADEIKRLKSNRKHIAKERADIAATIARLHNQTA